jgi:hypothetical protein
LADNPSINSGHIPIPHPAGDFVARQVEFAAHLRDPDQQPAPADVEDRRMQIYRDLFFNNISSFLANTFPVLRGCVSDEVWRTWIRDFYRDHASRTPLFTKLSREFVTYLAKERDPQPNDLPFMSDLAHYEWIEAELAMSPDPSPDASIDPQGDLLDGRPALSPLAWAFGYRFAVNEIDRDNQPTEPLDAPLHFLVYRDENDRVKFVKLNIVSARLFELLDTHPELSGREALEAIASELQHPKPDAVIEGGRAILDKWHELGVLPGTRNA